MTVGELGAIVVMALAVVLPKVVPLVLVGERLSPGVRSWLRFVAPAVLAALVAPAVVLPRGVLAAPSWDQAAYPVVLVVALRSRRVLPSLLAGLVVVAAASLARGSLG